ncbi:MAG: hypothetical protein R2827_02845 [Bdellovibrionales bacterium]
MEAIREIGGVKIIDTFDIGSQLKRQLRSDWGLSYGSRKAVE